MPDKDFTQFTEETSPVDGDYIVGYNAAGTEERRYPVSSIKEVSVSGTPVTNDFARFTDASTVEGRSYAETKTDLSLDNVENTAISTWTGSVNIATVGTITTGTWSGSTIALNKGGTGATTQSGARTALGLGTASTYSDASFLKVSGANSMSGDLNIDSNDIVSVDNVKYSASPATPLTTEGSTYYNSTSKCLAVKNDEADITLNVGQENWVRVYNNSGGTISNGGVVYITGKEDVEDRPTIALALSDSSSTSSVIGIATHDIENNSFGFVTQFGEVGGLDTSAFADGAPVWLSDSVAGGLTDTAPETPSVEVFIGWVLDSHATTGNLFFTTVGNTSGTTVTGEATELTLPARKGSAGTIAVGQTVYVSGAYNVGTNTVTVELADADGAGTYPAIGICSETITNSSTGRITVSGRINGLDTSTYSENDILYLSTTAGGLTNTKPVGSAEIQPIAIVLRSNVSSGVIEVLAAGQSVDVPNFTAADKFWYGGTGGVVTEGDLTTAARSVLDDASVSAMVNTLGGATSTGTGGLVRKTSAVLVTPSLGTPSALVGTNITGTGASFTAGQATAALGLKSATTTISVSTATAPTVGQTLTATSSTAATWQTPAGGGSGGTVQGTDGTYDIQATNEGATAGNARGENSVDLQTIRSAATMVASGASSTIGGGKNNTASGSYSATVSGGENNTASAYSCSVGGGSSNTASGNYATVGGGINNSATNNSATVNGGNSNTASGAYSTISGGRGNTASGYYATVNGGYDNTASGTMSTASGYHSLAGKWGQNTYAASEFASQGDSQISTLIASRQTTTATQTELFLDGDMGGSHRCTIATDTTWGFTISIVARRTDADGESAFYKIEGCIDNNAGTTALVGALSTPLVIEDTAGWAVTAEADNTNDALVVKVTGEAAKTIRWVAKIELVEVTG